MNVMRNEFLSKQKRIKNQRQRNLRNFLPGFYTESHSVVLNSNKKNRVDTFSNRLLVSKIVPSINCFNVPNASNRNDESSIEITAHEESETQDNETDTLDTFKEKLKISNVEHRSRKESTGSTSIEFRKLLEPFGGFRGDSETSGNYDKYFSKTNSEITFTNNAEDNILDSVFKKPRFSSTRINDGAHTSSDLLPTDTTSYSANSLHQSLIMNLRAPKNQKGLDKMLNVEVKEKSPHTEILEKISQTPDLKKIRSFISSSGHKTPKNKSGKFSKTSSSSKITVSEAETYILAVTEGRGHARGEVGIAVMDPKRPHLILCQISDSQTYLHSLTKMNVFEFVEVIVPNTFADGPTPSKLYTEIRSRFPTVTLTSVQRRHFSEAIGLDLIKQYCSPESASVMVLLRDKFYALSAAAALIKYIEFTQNVRLAPRSLRIEYQGTEDTMIIDLDTANLLELLKCTIHPEVNVNYSLLGVVKHCHTKGGVRLLKANILQPPCSLNKIETRLDCVSELVNNPLLLCSLEGAVGNLKDVESLLNLCMHAPQQDGLRVAEYQLKYTLLLKTMLELLPALSSSLEEAKSDYFWKIRENLKDPRYIIILNRILETVFENAKTVKGSVAAHLHGCFAIKPGINNLLDVAKKTYCEIVQEISDHVNKLRETYNLSLRISFSANKGFHIQYTLPPGLKSMKVNDLPKEFILAQKSKTTFSFYTAELVALDQRSQRVLNEIKLMTNVILFELLTDIREHIGCLFNLCEFVAELDIIISFAHVGSGNNYVRPRFGDQLNLVVSRHPILDVVHDGEVVPNDVFANPEKNFMILTGPNQSGKSIYIRQVALLQIMAQIGCYVPAKEATFRISNHIFSRIAFDDNIEGNASTLIVEMRDFEYIKRNITSNSIVIIDELCRGTSVDEGTSLAFALCEQLLDTSAFIFFTTHYLFLTKLEQLYYNVVNYHFETTVEMTESGKPLLKFTHQRKPGPTKAELYGIKVVEMTSFPKDVISKAKEISEKLTQNQKDEKTVNSLLAKYQLAQEFRYEIQKCDPELDMQKIEKTIREYREKYTNIFKNCDTEDEFLQEKPEVPEEKKVTTENDSSRKINSEDKKQEKNIIKQANNIKRKYFKMKLKKINKYKDSYNQ